MTCNVAKGIFRSKFTYNRFASAAGGGGGVTQYIYADCRAHILTIINRRITINVGLFFIHQPFFSLTKINRYIGISN